MNKLEKSEIKEINNASSESKFILSNGKLNLRPKNGRRQYNPDFEDS